MTQPKTQPMNPFATQDIVFSDATRLAEFIRTRQLSPVDVVQAHLDRSGSVTAPPPTSATTISC